MKKKSVRKKEATKQNVKAEEVKAEQPQPQRKNPLQAWDNLMFMRRRPGQSTSEEDK